MPVQSFAPPSQSNEVQRTSVRLRLASLDDVPALMEIICCVVPVMRASGNLQWNDDYPNPEVFERDIAVEHLWVAEVDGQVAGVVALTAEQSPEYADAGWDVTEPCVVVHRLAVHPEFHGRGIAAALMQQAEAVALQRGVAHVRTDTNTRNLAMQGLLPKLGYIFAGEIDLLIRPGQRFLCYGKKIPG